MTQPLLLSMLGGLITVLIAVLAYIGKQVLHKMDKIVLDMSLIDKHVDVIFERSRNSEKSMESLIVRLEKTEQEVSRSRDAIHQIRNDLAGYVRRGDLDGDS